VYPFSFSYTDLWLENILKEFNINFSANSKEIFKLREEYNSKVQYVKEKNFCL
jgi:hypothetical protein